MIRRDFVKRNFAYRNWAVLIPILGVCLAGCALARAQRLAVTNPLDVHRLDEVVDLPLSEVLRHVHAKDADEIVVIDEATKQLLPSQTYSTTGRGSGPLSCSGESARTCNAAPQLSAREPSLCG